MPIATTKANILNLVAQNRAIGVRTVLFTIAPKDDHTTAQKLLLSELNRWIVTLGAHGDVYPADVASAVVSLTRMTWNPAFSADGLRQNKIPPGKGPRHRARAPGLTGRSSAALQRRPTQLGHQLIDERHPGRGAEQLPGIPVELTRALVARTDQRPGQWMQFESPIQVNNTPATNSAAVALPAGVVPGTTRVFGVAEMESEPWVSAVHSGAQLSL